MFWLAFKIMLQERSRLAVTLVGIIFSTVLTLVEVAIYLGMMANATGIVRHSDADIWVTSKNVPNFDFSQPFPAYRIDRLRALDQVQWADKIHVAFAYLKLHDGRREQVQVVGFDPDRNVGGPWSMAVGNRNMVKGGHYMILDEAAEKRLGHLAVGSLWGLYLNGRERSFKLVGLSRGVVSFTTMPVVFISYNQLDQTLKNTGFAGDTSFIVAKLKDKGALQKVVRTLRAEMPYNDVYTKQQFMSRAIRYWTIQTGMGMAFFLTAILAVLIGGAIVGQTIYAGTMEHLRDYGTLKAMGAHNRDINMVIFSQAATSALLGFAFGAILTLVARGIIGNAGVPIVLPFSLFAAVFVIVVLTCLAAGYISVRKVKTLDPVMVFRE